MTGLVKTGVVLATGAGLLALRSTWKKKCHPTIVSEYPELHSHFPDLCADVSMVSEFGDELGFRAVLDLLDDIRKEDVSDAHAAQHNIAHLSSRLVRFLEGLIERHKRGASDAAYRTSMYCNDCVLPELKAGLENILHNHLLRRDARAYDAPEKHRVSGG